MVWLTGWMVLSGAAAAQTAPPVVYGEPEAGFPTAVSLGADLFGERLSLCTGNLITTRLILTAAHCTDFIPTELLVLAGRAYVGPDIWSAEHELVLVERFVHPDYVELDADANEIGAFDISVVVTEEEAPIRPMWIRLDSLDSSLVDTEMVSIGFGLDEREESGVKRSAVLTLDELDRMFLLSRSGTNPNGATICSGDSGGPQVALVDDEWEQWGVHSWGDARCRATSGSQRIDVALDWVLDQVEAVHGTRDLCVANGWAGDGTCDPRCERYGDVDPDCEPPEESDGSADANANGKSGDESKAGCSTVPSDLPFGASVAWLACLVVTGRRRRCHG